MRTKPPVHAPCDGTSRRLRYRQQRYRVLIPSRLRKLVPMDDDQEIHLVGMYHRLEIWGPSEWRRYLTRNEDRVEQDMAKIQNLSSVIGRPLRLRVPSPTIPSIRSTSLGPDRCLAKESPRRGPVLRTDRREAAVPPHSTMPDQAGGTVTMIPLPSPLPIPPSVNHQYATVNGRRLLSAKGRAFKVSVGQQILVALAQSPHRGTLSQTLQQASLPFDPVLLCLALRRDTDGGLKIAQDALCEGLGLNDNRVVETHLYKSQDRDNPRMEIQLSVAVGACIPRTSPHPRPHRQHRCKTGRMVPDETSRPGRDDSDSPA